MLKRKLVGGRLLACLIAAGTIAFLAPAGAGAATTVGSTFTPSGFDCQDNLFQLQTTSPSSTYVVPSAGVLTSWSHEASATNAPTNLKLEVGRTTAPNTFLTVGNSVAKVPTAGTTNTYTDISIPVQAGDLLGMHSNGTNRNCGVLTSGYTVNYIGLTDPAPGDSVVTAFTSGFRLDISATLEADCDADGLGDETEDGDRSTCSPVLAPVGDKSAVEGQTLSFPVTATDPNVGDTLTYSASSLPPGASFNASTHTFSWTPAAGQAGSYPGVRFTVGDGTLPELTDSEDVTITVSKPVVPSTPTTTPTTTAPPATPTTTKPKCKKKKHKRAAAAKKCKKKRH
jgi:hypothetical protein